MAGQRGRDILIKLSDGLDPESFVTVAGIRTTKMELQSGLVDSTTASSPDGWRELIPNAGIRTAKITGRGVFKDKTSDEMLRAAWFAGTHLRCQLIVPDFGSLTGQFQISSLEWGGEYDGEASFSIALDSSGEISFAVLS